MIKTAVVILNWNGIGWLQRFLETSIRFTVNRDAVIYVADNGSTDGSVKWISDNFKNIRIINLVSNFGFAGGYNRALNQIDAEYYVLLNSDMQVTEGWLNPLVRYMDQNPGTASCQPKIKSFQNKDYFEYAGAAGGFIDKFGYPFCRGRVFDFIEKDNGQYDNPADIFWSSGACMIVRSDAWKKCGGFDDDFFAHMEEIDLWWRFHLAGFRVACVPESVVYHVGGGALHYDSPFKTYLNFRNNLFLLYKNLPDNKLHIILFVRKSLDGLAALRFLLKGKPGSVRAIWNAHLDYYKSIKRLKEKRKFVTDLSINKSVGQLMNKSVVFRFYIKGQKTFSSFNIRNL